MVALSVIMMDELPNDVRSGVLEQIAKLRGELLVAVQDEESLAAQKAVEWVGEIPTDLAS